MLPDDQTLPEGDIKSACSDFDADFDFDTDADFDADADFDDDANFDADVLLMMSRRMIMSAMGGVLPQRVQRLLTVKLVGLYRF